MPFKTYQANLHSAVLNNSRGDEAAIRQILTWYTGSGRDEFVKAFEHETGLTIGKRKDGALVEQGYAKNINEYPGKTAWTQYYIANAIIALGELDRLLSPGVPLASGQSQIFYRNIAGLSRKLFLDTIVLLEDWATFVQGAPGIFGIGKSRWEHGVAIYQSGLQVIYGNDSPLAFADNHSDTSVNQLRMAIELRLRRGFGILAKLNKEKAIVPIALSDVILVIAQHKHLIEFAVPFEHIERLYQWANIYMHSGLKQYVWSPIYALHYLRPFLLGGRHAGGSSTNAGIIAPYGVVKQIQSDIESTINKAQFTLMLEDPQQCDLVLKTP